jgi:hypothetical protein
MWLIRNIRWYSFGATLYMALNCSNYSRYCRGRDSNLENKSSIARRTESVHNFLCIGNFWLILSSMFSFANSKRNFAITLNFKCVENWFPDITQTAHENQVVFIQIYYVVVYFSCVERWSKIRYLPMCRGHITNTWKLLDRSLCLCIRCCNSKAVVENHIWVTSTVLLHWQYNNSSWDVPRVHKKILYLMTDDE